MLRKEGREGLIRRIDEEKQRQDQRPLPDDFDDAILPGLMVMEGQFWKHERSSEARRIFKRRILELRQQEEGPNKRIKRRINYPLTREEIIRMTIRPLAPKLSREEEDAIVKRLVQKMRKAGEKLPS